MSELSFQIREANEADVEIIADYNLRLSRETESRELDPETVRNGVARFVAEPQRGRYYVAVEGDDIIGQSAYTHEWSDWRNGDLWWIQSVYVRKDHRGKGVFRALFEHIRALGEADPDCCSIRLYMERDNHTARKTYLQLGFKETGYEVLETSI